MTGTDSTGGTRFDEQAALAELERLQRAIEASRRKRGETVDAFDAFVRSFRTPSRPQGNVKDEDAEGPPVPDAPSETGPAEAVPSATESVASESVEPPDPTTPAPQRPRRVAVRLPVIVGIGVVIAAGASLTILARRSSLTTASHVQPAATPGTAVPSSAQVAPGTSAPASSPTSAADRDGLRVEFTAVKPVWVRVTVDGERALERELRTGDRFPFKAQRAIVIRAGNAGAVRVTVGGQDQGLLGREGDVVSRTFSQTEGKGKDR